MKISGLAFAFFAFSAVAVAADLVQKDTRSEAQKTFDSNKANADRVSKDIADKKKAEAMRDKSHDNRIKVGKDTSVGVGADGISVKKTIP